MFAIERCHRRLWPMVLLLSLPGLTCSRPLPADELAAGAAHRARWTNSHVRGSPEPPPPFRVAQLFPEVRLEHPVALAMPPGDDRWWVAEQGGKVFVVQPDRGRGRAELALDLRADLAARPAATARLDALYGLAFSPNFKRDRSCILSYTVVAVQGEHLPDGTRVSRFRVTADDPPRIDPESEEILLTFLEGGHNGACLAFGPDGCLYISTGDGESPSPPDARHTGQDLSDLLSSILRIDIEHPSQAQAYSIPPDNPFIGRPDTRPEIWAYGFRNPWKMSFDRQSGDLLVGDVGWELWELVHKVERGSNAGWSIVEGRQPVDPDRDPGPSPITPPLIEIPHTMGASVTGGFVYRGSRFPELQGSYIFGDWETRRLWAWPVAAGRVRDAATQLPNLADSSVRIVAFGEDHRGELCLLDYDAGTLHELVRQPPSVAGPEFPRRLSETGLFASVAEHRLAPGVMPFVVNAPQWSDGATSQRAIAWPGDGRVRWHADPVEIPGSMFSRRLEFPDDAVLLKTLSWKPPDAPPGASARRVETQLLHFDGRQWRGYAYRWNAELSDADLVPADGDETILIWPGDLAGAEPRRMRWTFASRSQCLVCHNPWSETALAFNPLQLARPSGASPAGASWEEYVQRDIIELSPPGDLAASTAPQFTALVDPRDEQQPLAARARSYLHANCSHCHQFGGGGSVQIDLRWSATPEQMKALDERPIQGGLGLENARIIAAGDPDRSVLLLRMATSGRGHMPHLGSEHPDRAALALIRDWIVSLADDASPSRDNRARAASGLPAGPARQAAFEHELNSSLKAALALALDRESLAADARSDLLAAVTQLNSPAVRDLFTDDLPQPDFDRVGLLPRPRRILSKSGDTARGRTLFRESKTLNCATCHRVQDEGGQVGPELTHVAARRTREDLLESLLDPSRSIEPAFASYVVQTTDGRVWGGVLADRSSEVIRLRDAKNELLTISMSDVEAIQPQRTSLMPEGLIKDLTLAEAADLLAYLESLR